MMGAAMWGTAAVALAGAALLPAVPRLLELWARQVEHQTSREARDRR